MCGIVGIAGKSLLLDKKLVITLRETMRHRGQDNAGCWLSPSRHLELAQRQLSITELVVAWRQPMAAASARYTLVFNREIYNYRELRKEVTCRAITH